MLPVTMPEGGLGLGCEGGWGIRQQLQGSARASLRFLASVGMLNPWLSSSRASTSLRGNMHAVWGQMLEAARQGCSRGAAQVQRQRV